MCPTWIENRCIFWSFHSLCVLPMPSKTSRSCRRRRTTPWTAPGRRGPGRGTGSLSDTRVSYGGGLLNIDASDRYHICQTFYTSRLLTKNFTRKFVNRHFRHFMTKVCKSTFRKVPIFRCPKMGLWVPESKNWDHFFTATSPQNRLPLLDAK